MRRFTIWDDQTRIKTDEGLDLEVAQEKVSRLNKGKRRFYIYPDGTDLPVRDFTPEPSCPSCLNAGVSVNRNGMRRKHI